MNLSLTNKKLVILATNIILGSILIYSYYHYITKSGVAINKLWGKAYKVRKIYIVSMILAAIGYLFIIVFSVFKTPNDKFNNILLSKLIVIQVLIILVSMLWLPLTLVHIMSNVNKLFTMSLIVIVLFIVAMVSAKQFLLVRNLKPNNNNYSVIIKSLAELGAGYFFIHTFFFDFIGWNIGFFS